MRRRRACIDAKAEDVSSSQVCLRYGDANECVGHPICIPPGLKFMSSQPNWMRLHVNNPTSDNNDDWHRKGIALDTHQFGAITHRKQSTLSDNRLIVGAISRCSKRDDRRNHFWIMAETSARTLSSRTGPNRFRVWKIQLTDGKVSCNHLIVVFINRLVDFARARNWGQHLGTPSTNSEISAEESKPSQAFPGQLSISHSKNRCWAWDQDECYPLTCHVSVRFSGRKELYTRI
jgi:hypothetical protein